MDIPAGGYEVNKKDSPQAGESPYTVRKHTLGKLAEDTQDL